MYTNLKEEILPLLKDMSKTSPEYKMIIKILERQDKAAKGAILWCADDVIERARQCKKWCKIPSKKEAQEILEELIDNHDCNYGITWEHIDTLLTPRKIKSI